MEKSVELREEWNEEKEELKEEYGAEIEHKEKTRFSYSINGEHYTADWAGGDVYRAKGDGSEEEIEFGEKYGELWQSKLGDLSKFISEETDFDHSDQDETGQRYRGTGRFSRFRMRMPYLPTSTEKIGLYYLKQEHIGDAAEIREELKDKGVLDKEG